MNDIRALELLGLLIGVKVLEITADEQCEDEPDEDACIYLHFDNGVTLKFPIPEEGFQMIDHPAYPGGEDE